MKFDEKLKAIAMRKQGKSYAHILREVRVSKSTLSVWLRDIVLSKEQQKEILHGREISRYAGAKAQQQRRIDKTNFIIATAKGEFSHLKSSQIFLPGLSFYWAEGDKHQQERVKLTNSDPLMIIFMMRWFREVCHVKEERFRIALHVHTLHTNLKEIQTYWSSITGVPLKQFQKLYIKKTTLQQRRNILYKGTCGIVINDKTLFRRIVGWKLAFQRYFDLSDTINIIK